MTQPKREFGDGPLSRWAGTIYWFAAVGMCLAVTLAPSAAVVLFLDRHVSNIPLYALAAAPVGPALAAGLFAWRARERDPYPVPTRHFWRGYAMNAREVLAVWVPAVALIGVLAFNAAHLDAVAVPPGTRWVIIAFAVLAMLWAANLLVITASFSFRWRDSLRLAVYFLAAQPLVTLGTLSVLVLGFGLVYFVSDWALLLAGPFLSFLHHRAAAAMVRDLETTFTHPPR